MSQCPFKTSDTGSCTGNRPIERTSREAIAPPPPIAPRDFAPNSDASISGPQAFHRSPNNHTKAIEGLLLASHSVRSSSSSPLSGGGDGFSLVNLSANCAIRERPDRAIHENSCKKYVNEDENDSDAIKKSAATRSRGELELSPSKRCSGASFDEVTRRRRAKHEEQEVRSKTNHSTSNVGDRSGSELRACRNTASIDSRAPEAVRVPSADARVGKEARFPKRMSPPNLLDLRKNDAPRQGGKRLHSGHKAGPEHAHARTTASSDTSTLTQHIATDSSGIQLGPIRTELEESPIRTSPEAYLSGQAGAGSVEAAPSSPSRACSEQADCARRRAQFGECSGNGGEENHDRGNTSDKCGGHGSRGYDPSVNGAGDYHDRPIDGADARGVGGGGSGIVDLNGIRSGEDVCQRHGLVSCILCGFRDGVITAHQQSPLHGRLSTFLDVPTTRRGPCHAPETKVCDRRGGSDGTIGTASVDTSALADFSYALTSTRSTSSITASIPAARAGTLRSGEGQEQHLSSATKCEREGKEARRIFCERHLLEDCILCKMLPSVVGGSSSHPVALKTSMSSPTLMSGSKNSNGRDMHETANGALRKWTCSRAGSTCKLHDIPDCYLCQSKAHGMHSTSPLTADTRGVAFSGSAALRTGHAPLLQAPLSEPRRGSMVFRNGLRMSPSCVSATSSWNANAEEIDASSAAVKDNRQGHSGANKGSKGAGSDALGCLPLQSGVSLDLDAGSGFDVGNTPAPLRGEGPRHAVRDVPRVARADRYRSDGWGKAPHGSDCDNNHSTTRIRNRQWSGSPVDMATASSTSTKNADSGRTDTHDAATRTATTNHPRVFSSASVSLGIGASARPRPRRQSGSDDPAAMAIRDRRHRARGGKPRTKRVRLNPKGDAHRRGKVYADTMVSGARARENRCINHDDLAARAMTAALAVL